MMHTKLFKQAVLVLFVVGVLNWIGDVLYLYDSIWWYDILLHILSGVVVGMSVFVVWDFFVPLHNTPKGKIIFVAILAALIVGILWEYYELYFGLTYLSDGMLYVVDTVKDIIDDMLGGYLGALYAIRILLKKNG